MTPGSPRTALLMALAGLGSGCSREPVDLVTAADWVLAPASADPMPGHIGSEPCSPSGVYPELGGLEVDTELCPYALVQQPLAARVRRGDILSLNWYHSDLISDPPATGHLLLAVDGLIVYERDIEIPTDAQAYLDEWPAEESMDSGALVVLHLHNHGFNTWNFFQWQRR